MEDNLTDNMEGNLIRRCCVCKAIILNGILTPPEKYSEKELVNRGFYFSDGIFSKECLKKADPEFYSIIDKSKFDYESCKIQ